jgi:hypothetical protein
MNYISIKDAFIAIHLKSKTKKTQFVYVKGTRTEYVTIIISKHLQDLLFNERNWSVLIKAGRA